MNTVANQIQERECQPMRELGFVTLTSEKRIKGERSDQKVSSAMAQAQIEQEVEFFRGYKYVLSNFYYCKLIIDGLKFNSSEKAYQVLKARFHNAKDIEAQLMEADLVSDVKKISQKINVSAEWIDERVNVMRKVLRAKADQCQTYRKKLLNCKGRIVEAIRGDLFWSAGLDEKDLRELPTESWPGQNVLGQLHMELRDELQEFLRAQSQSKKRTIEYKEFVGKKKQRTNEPPKIDEASKPSYYFEIPNLKPTNDVDVTSKPSYYIDMPNLEPTVDTGAAETKAFDEWMESTLQYDCPLLNPQPDMFNTRAASPEEDKAIEEFLNSIASQTDKNLVTDPTSTEPKPLKSKFPYNEPHLLS